MNMQVLDASRDMSGGYKVDVGRGERIGRVSSEWFSRPDDERYLSLDELARSVRDRAKRSRTRVVESALIHVEASRTDPERLSLILPGSDAAVAPTHWSFGQLASQVGAPAAYLRQLPASLAGINLQYGLASHRAEQIKTLETDEGRIELRAVTGPDYGRIYDYELVEAVQRIAGNGTGDTRWKVPGVLDWSTGIYNPRVDITKDTTTLYASDRDVFLFLVDDLNPIEAGRLPDGSPDLYFRGFYCWNSEVGAKTLGMASFYLRAVCQNRNLWGVEDFEEITTSGVDRDGIGEHIFPADLAFVIYRKGMTPDLGNISAMWRNHSDEFLRRAIDPRTLRCGSGSLCDARGGACPACIMVSEVSCIASNLLLSRGVLKGGLGPEWEPRSAPDLVGFLDPAVAG